MDTTLKLTVCQYDQMVAKGAFDGLGQKIELIEGEIHAMSPAGPRHDYIIEYLTHWSVRNTDFDRIRVRVQSGLSLADQESRPEPDLLWVRADHPADRHPIAEESLLLIEVSDSSIGVDRQRKAALYARGGIPEYWVVDLGEQSIHVFREPSASGYRTMESYPPGRRLSPLSVPQSTLDPGEFFR